MRLTICAELVQVLALDGKSWQRSNFDSFLGVKRRVERVYVMPALAE
jgi:hypothetical protein